MMRRGSVPTNENRPETSFFSVDSNKKLYRPLSSFLNAETGVSQSATNSAKTGITLPRSASRENSVSVGLSFAIILVRRQRKEICEDFFAVPGED